MRKCIILATLTFVLLNVCTGFGFFRRESSLGIDDLMLQADATMEDAAAIKILRAAWYRGSRDIILNSLAVHNSTGWRIRAEKGSADAQWLWAQYLDDGLNGRPDYAEAKRYYLSAVDQGHLDAMVSYGLFLNFGRGGEVDEQQAMKWFAQAAKAGHPEGQRLLSLGYTFGVEVPKDSQKARKWLEKAINNGNYMALLTKADYHREGLNYAKNHEKVHKIIRQLAENKLIPAMRNMGYLYTKGIGVDVDPEKAIEWFEEASRRGNRNSTVYLHHYYLSELKKRGTDKEVLKRILEQATVTFHVKSLYYLFQAHLQGIPGAPDAQTALNMLRTAAERGDSLSMAELGDLYSNAEPQGDNEEKAFQWYLKAARRGLPYAMLKTCSCFYEGKGTASDRNMARKWLVHVSQAPNTTDGKRMFAISEIQRTFEDSDPENGVRLLRELIGQGDAEAAYYLGMAMLEGKTVNKDNRGAIKNLRRCAEDGSAVCIQTLATLYRFGAFGIPVDTRESIAWLNKGVDLRDPDSIANLALIKAELHGDYRNIDDAKKLCDLLIARKDPRGHVIMATGYRFGWWEKTDPYEAERHYRAAIEQGSPEAVVDLTLMLYLNGSRSAPTITDKDLYLLELAAQSGNPEAKQLYPLMAQQYYLKSYASRRGRSYDVYSAPPSAEEDSYRTQEGQLRYYEEWAKIEREQKSRRDQWVNDQWNSGYGSGSFSNGGSYPWAQDSQSQGSSVYSLGGGNDKQNGWSW